MKFWLTALLVMFFAPQFVCAEDNLTQQLEDHFRLYLIKAEKRSQSDRITVTGDQAVLYYWESMDHRKPDEVICEAYQWLLLGRTTYGRGAQEAFERFPSLQQIDLSFYDIEFSTKKVTQRAEILPIQKTFEYLRIGVKRELFLKKMFNRKDVKKMIENRQCAELGKIFIDVVAIDEIYLKGKK